MRAIFTFCLMSLLGVSHLAAQTSCANTTAGQLPRNAQPMIADDISPTILPALQINPSGATIPQTEYIITKANSLAADGRGNEIIGTIQGNSFLFTDYGLADGDLFYVTVFSYHLAEWQQVIDELLTNEITPGNSCCNLFSLIPNMADACTKLNNVGIYSGTDVDNLEAIIRANNAMRSYPNISIEELVLDMDTLNQYQGLFPTNCGKTALPICYAVALPEQAYYEADMLAIAVNQITITPDTTTILLNTVGHTMQATVLPANATNSQVSWSVLQGNSVSIDANTGELTPLAVGLTRVQAMAQDGSGVVDEAVVVVDPVVVFPTSVSVSPTPTTLTSFGSYVQLTATVLPANATNQDVDWAVTTGASVVVDGNGLATAIAQGVSIVTATTEANGLTGDATIIVNLMSGVAAAESAAAVVYTIYPNPSKGQSVLSVHAPTAIGESRLILTDMLGRAVYERVLWMGQAQESFELDWRGAGVSAGLYQMAIQNAAGNQVIRLRLEE